jgi:D-amino-acid dehydrogenase
MKVLVLGGGVIGVTTAWLLARSGHEVAVVEQAAEPARGTSEANGALLHTSLVAPWNPPGIGWQLIGALARRHGASRVRPAALPAMLGWGLAFVLNSAPERHRRHTLLNLELALLSARVLREIRADTGIAYDHAERGILTVVRTAPQLAAIRANARLLADQASVPSRELTPAEITRLEPALAEVSGALAGGLHFPEDESGDCRLFTLRLAEAAAGIGVRFHFETKARRLEATAGRVEATAGRVEAVITDRGRLTADHYVLATGWSSPALASSIGLRLPVQPVKGTSLTVPLDRWEEPPRLPVVDDSLHIAATPIGDRLRIAACADFVGPDSRLEPDRCDYAFAAACRVYPALRHHAEPTTVARWAGLRPMTPDGVPILGPSRYPNLLLNTGHGHLGWTFACGSARVTASLIDGGRSPIDLAGFTHDRFG